MSRKQQNKVGLTGKRWAILMSIGLSLIFLTMPLYAAKPLPSPLSCGISPDTGTASAGTAITFTGSADGGAKGGKSYLWNFSDGSGTPAASSSNPVDVTYGTGGTYNVLLTATDRDNTQENCSTTVTVSAVAENVAPVAQNDDYNTKQDILLSIDAPGVLFNDNDPDGDPMTAVLEVDVTEGTLNLSADGSFTYDPAPDFSGSVSFTYHADDGALASNPAVVNIGVTADGAVSINSTSASGFPLPGSAVSELDLSSYLPNSNYAIVAINDLGMHCGDLDTRISSILPPFNVLHSQVIERGNGGLPRILGKNEVKIFYSAASNSNDPAPAKVASGQALSSVAADGTVYKTNFWDTVAEGAYDPFYPYADPFGNILIPLTPLSEAPFNVTTDVGLPMPDTTLLYLGADGIPGTGDEALGASQQFMPSFNNTTRSFEPYVTNEPQPFHEHIGTMPFFITFPFGYTADVNLFEAAGTPISAFDDFGRENPYPLVKVHAEVAGTPVAAIDIVMPISGEAECQSCHSADVGTEIAVSKLTGIGDVPGKAFTIDDPLYDDAVDDTGSSVPFEVAVEWASDINLLRLHDLKHGTTLDAGYNLETGQSSDPVVCQTCHYTPALDLAQLGPQEGLPGTFANGRDQVKHKSMSNVMHGHHGTVDVNGLSPGDPDYIGGNSDNLLIPIMPPAINGAGERRDPVTTQTVLEDSCYLCHPGKRTQCMRGAMANGGLVCQDCHGQMQDVGDDFTRSVTAANDGSEFELGPDFYTNPALPRVPWANEPGCGSCHTGYATDNMAGDPNVLVSPTDTLGNTDNIRLLAAYLQNDDKATPIVPANKAFAENVVTANDLPGHLDAIGNPKLYRVSTGHGGLFCEACHGSTHAEWPTANPNANDNIPASQLQGHSGYISECAVCHEPNDESLPMGNNGPHGMHPISDRYNVIIDPDGGIYDDNGNVVIDPDYSGFTEDLRWNTDHKSYKNDGPGCNACHGADLKGTVLSRTAKHRVIKCKDDKGSLPGCAAGDEYAVIPKGTPVGCGLCHQQKRR